MAALKQQNNLLKQHNMLITKELKELHAVIEAAGLSKDPTGVWRQSGTNLYAITDDGDDTGGVRECR